MAAGSSLHNDITAKPTRAGATVVVAAISTSSFDLLLFMTLNPAFTAGDPGGSYNELLLDLPHWAFDLEITQMFFCERAGLFILNRCH